MTKNYFELKPISERARIEVVAPSGTFDKRYFNAGLNFLRMNQISPAYEKSLFDKYFYTAGDERSRAEALINAFTNKENEAVWAVRGGFGAIHLLPYLEEHIEDLKKNGKLMIGFSDITVLQSFLVDRCGMVCVHAPNVTTLNKIDGYSKSHLINLLQLKEEGFSISSRHISVVQEGKVRGVVKGGNLASLASLMGTPYEPDFDGCILFLEDVNEVPYKVDRMLTQMRMAGKFKNIKGLVLGEFSYKDRTRNVNVNTHEQTAYELARYRGKSPVSHVNPNLIINKMGLGPDVPVICNFPAGHGKHNMAFLLGALAELNTEYKSLSYNI